MKVSAEASRIGIIWLVLSPLLLILALISTVKSDTTYYVQIAIFSAMALSAFFSGIGTLLHQEWARKALIVLSFLGSLYFGGAGILMLFYSIPAIFKNDLSALMVLPIAFGTAALGAPFYFMAKRLKRASFVSTEDI